MPVKKQVLSAEEARTTKTRSRTFNNGSGIIISWLIAKPSTTADRSTPIPIHLDQVQCKWLSFRKTPTDDGRRSEPGLEIIEEAGDRKAARKMRVRIQEKFSFPAICLVFGLIGASLGARGPILAPAAVKALASACC